MQISKRKFGIIIVIISILGLGVWAYFLFIYTAPPVNNEPIDSDSSFAPSDGLNPALKPLDGLNTTDEILLPPSSNEDTKKMVLRQLIKDPISGMISISKTRLKETPPIDTTPADAETSEKKVDEASKKPEIENYTAIRYADKATGHVYEFALDKENSKKLISGTDIPSSHEAFFGDNGDTLIIRYLQNDGQSIETFMGILPKDIQGGDALPVAKGSFLDENIFDLSVAPDTSKIFYLEPFDGKVIGITSSPTGSKKTQVFDSFFHGWTSQWINLKYIGIYTKPSGSVPGFSYMLDLGAKNMKRIVGGINGLISNFSPSSSLVAYSDSNLSLKILNIKTGEFVNAGARTFADKCKWGKDDSFLFCAAPNSIPIALYPDAWYNGSISFSDSIWRFDSKTGAGTYLYDLSTSGTDIDAVGLSLNADENYLFFTNKKDSSLWSLKLK